LIIQLLNDSQKLLTIPRFDYMAVQAQQPTKAFRNCHGTAFRKKNHEQIRGLPNEIFQPLPTILVNYTRIAYQQVNSSTSKLSQRFRRTCRHSHIISSLTEQQAQP